MKERRREEVREMGVGVDERERGGVKRREDH